MRDVASVIPYDETILCFASRNKDIYLKSCGGSKPSQ